MTAPYNDTVMEHFRRPRNRAPLEAPHGAAEVLNPLCGDRIRMEVRLAGERVEAAAFAGDGCALSIAAASLLTGAVRGHGWNDVAALGEAEVLELLGVHVPPSRLRCATLPLEALHEALRRARAAREGP